MPARMSDCLLRNDRRARRMRLLSIAAATVIAFSTAADAETAPTGVQSAPGSEPSPVDAVFGDGLTRGGPTRIVGGEIADPRHWPGFAAFRQTSEDGEVINYFCGGVAVTSRWVLTAAHCLTDHADGPVARAVALPGGETRSARLQVVLGATDLADLHRPPPLTRDLAVPGGPRVDTAAARAELDSLLAAAAPVDGLGFGTAPFGEPAAEPARDYAVFDVERIVLHPDYRVALRAIPNRFGRRERQALEAMLPVVTGRDIALVRLARPWAGATMPLSLEPETDPAPGAAVRVAGFGATERPSFRPEARLMTAPGERPAIYAPSSVLREAGMPIMDSGACQTSYADIGAARIGRTELCAGLPEGGRAACSGDSGGPLISLGEDGPILIGLVSWGPTDPGSCGQPGRGVVYTRVSSYANWVRDVVSADAPTGEAVAQGAPPEPVDVLRQIDLKAFVRQLGDLLGGEAQRNLTLTIDRGARLPVGAETSFTLRSARTGFPVLLDVDANRRLNVILPTGSVTARDLPRAPAGQPFILPQAIDRITSYEVVPPLGKGLLIGLIAPTRGDVAALTVLDGLRTRDTAAKRAPALALMRLLRSIEAAVGAPAAPELGAEALTPGPGAAQSPRDDWGVAIVEYEVVASE